MTERKRKAKGQAVATTTEANVEATTEQETQTVTSADVGEMPAGVVDGVVALATALATPAKKVKVLPTLDEALAKAREAKPALYLNVIRVIQLTKDGEPKRVIIKCQDPQTKKEGDKEVSVCAVEREIAVQDLFQVTRCLPCADRVVRKQRRARQKSRMKRLKQADRARKQGM
jgi:hypothetical protein